MWKRTPTKVEDIQVQHEPVNFDTYNKVYPYEGCGMYNDDRTKRLIVWIDAEDNDEYPRTFFEWYPVGTMIPLEIWSDR